MVVAGGVAAALQVVVLPFGFLCTAAGEVTLTLLGDYVCDVTALALEVVAHGGGLVARASLLEYRLTHHFAHRVLTPYGIDLAAVHVELDFSRIKFEVAIVNARLTVHEHGVAAFHHH